MCRRDGWLLGNVCTRSSLVLATCRFLAVLSFAVAEAFAALFREYAPSDATFPRGLFFAWSRFYSHADFFFSSPPASLYFCDQLNSWRNAWNFRSLAPSVKIGEVNFQNFQRIPSRLSLDSSLGIENNGTDIYGDWMKIIIISSVRRGLITIHKHLMSIDQMVR